MNLKICFRLRDFVSSKSFLRFVAVFTLIVGVSAVQFWQTSDNFPDASENVVENVYAVQIVPNLSSSEAEIQNRDLSEYTFGGRFSNEFSNPMLHSAEAFDYARNFILKNFKEKKRAYIIYDFTGVDTGFDIYYFIEPDKNGVWRVVERYKTAYLGADSVIHKTYEYIFYKIKKNRISENSDKVYLGSFYLSFLDKDGNEINVL